MATPDFVLALREKIGTAPLWLSGVTAVVVRDDDVLLVRRADNGAWTPVTGIIDPAKNRRRRPFARSRRRRAFGRDLTGSSGCTSPARSPMRTATGLSTWILCSV